ncbi:hypothetical protein XCR1_880005 [Xenorhabdus cabanillasii JM26]|uniref:Uncharacterized protein n=1 Tax=Xenorhabdus cabanillasii JM26 TaxID=1427517 RepID=W1J962_9GAMM|nr:hypothetical protein Xcab_03462 [Xenorhabdus cabanillasii JM26]CDL87307.1 hypothetical protein XCR1_880005 [Xenorhabdus cabanillasii JM26]
MLSIKLNIVFLLIINNNNDAITLRHCYASCLSFEAIANNKLQSLSGLGVTTTHLLPGCECLPLA